NKGEFEKAIDYFNRALLKNPNFKEAEEKRTLALLSLNKIDSLIEEYYTLLEKEKTSDTYLKLGNVLYLAGRLPEARAVLMEGIKKFEYDSRLKFLLIEVLKEEGATHRAGILAKEWLEDTSWIDEEKTPNKDEVLIQLRFTLNELRIEAHFIDTAEEDLEKIENKESYPAYYILKSKILMERNKGIEAAQILKEAREKFPAHLGILSQLVHVLTSIGELEQAREIQTQIIGINPAAVIQQVEMENYKATDEQVELLERLLNSVAIPKATRASAGFALHKVLEKRKNYDRAFEVLIKANELVKEELTYDWKEHRLMIQKTIEVFTPELVEKLKGKGHPSKRPIFVLGMPRSGTTLTEQILGSHSMVYPAGELGFVPRIVSLIPKVLKMEGKEAKRWPEAMVEFNEKLLKSAAQYYLDKVAMLDDRHPRIVDKLPHNFDYVGLILLMFPNAKVIHLVRNDLDVAVSNYQQNFAAKHGTMGFAFDLKWIGHMLNDHKAIMEHWHKLFPGQIYDLDYQHLTEEPETVIREILEFCELPWEDAVLEFYKTKRPVKTASIKQVRQGIYRSSVEKWRRYEKFLEPVIKLLEEGFKPLNEGDIIEFLRHEDMVKPAGFFGYTIPA
ncbi:MAG TPA: sulfotransferase family protein, partial [Thermodesulfobacterium geofontis]|nr:sulfotransferase family protein [Thermodesulfobacterium geofontis]